MAPQERATQQNLFLMCFAFAAALALCLCPSLTLKAPIMTAADDNFATSFLIFEKNKVFVIFEKAAKFDIVVCCKL